MPGDLPSAGKDSTVQLLLDLGPGVPVPAFGTSVLETAAQNFSVNAEQHTITTMHLGTTEPDEDMTPRGFSGTITASLRDSKLQQAYDLYQEAKRNGQSVQWMIVHDLGYRGTGAASARRTVTYLRVELSMTESYEPGRANQATISWRSPQRV